MIVTLTLNPAIDLALSTDRIVYDDRSFILGEQESAGGKGINAARVIHSYGGEVHAIATRGGQLGGRFEELLRGDELSTTLIPVEGETRRNLAVTDEQGLTIKLDHVGAPLTAAELGAVDKAVCAKLPSARWLMLTGSQPPDVPVEFFAQLIQRAHEHGVPTLLDSTGQALRQGLGAKPAVAKPNRPEAERLLGRTLLSRAHAASAAQEIQQMGAETVILSLGSQGVIAAWAEGLLTAVSPSVETGCPIGAGDVLAATYVWALTEGESFPDALRWAVAAATAAAALPGLSFAGLNEIQPLRERVELRSI